MNKKEIVDFLKSNYIEEEITNRLDDEILNWIDEDWSDDYECEYDWYVDHNNKEAEDVVIDEIIKEIKRKFREIPIEINLIDIVKEVFKDLD